MRKKAQKAESLEQQQREINDAWRAANQTPANEVISDWIIETFDDEIIVEAGGELFKVGFTREGEEIVFADRSEWLEVERTVEFVEKSARAFIKLTGRNSLKSISRTDDHLTVGNYMVLFGDEENRDLTKEFFTSQTKFESQFTETGELDIDWEHGFGKAIDGVGPDEDDILGVVDWDTAKVDEMGLWAERVLNRRNEYMQFIEPLIDARMVGTSTKAVDGEFVVAKNGEITDWPLHMDSITVMPAEPRMMTDNVVSALKSLAKTFPELKAMLPKGSEDPVADAKPKETSASKNLNLEVQTMSKKDEKEGLKTKRDILNFYCDITGKSIEDLTDVDRANAFAGTQHEIIPDEVVAETERTEVIDRKDKNLDTTLQELLKYAQEQKSINGVGYISADGGEADKHLHSFGDFLVAVARNDRGRLKSIYKSTYNEKFAGDKADMSHIDGAPGGFLLPVEFENNLLKLADESSNIRNMTTIVPVGSNRGKWPTLDQFTAPTAGLGNTAFAGGVVATPTGENTTLTETRPLFKEINWNIHKVGGITQAPNELIADSPMAIEVLLNTLFALSINAKREHYIFRGTGSNEPLGILNSNALISVTTVADNTFAETDGFFMLSRFKKFLSNGAWFIHPGVIPDFGAMEIGSAGPTFITDLNTQDVFGRPFIGKPVFQSEHLPQDDNSGDVLLADMKAYLLFERQGMMIAFSEHVAFKEDQGTFRFTQRMDGQPWLKGAVTLADPQGSFTVSPFVKHND